MHGGNANQLITRNEHMKGGILVIANLFLAPEFSQGRPSFTLPQYGSAFSVGTNRDSSCCQLCKVEAGATTRKGPQMSCASARYASNDID
jgi:hypothetical protein